MRVDTRYIYEIQFRSPHDAAFIVSALEGAAREWAQSSNESEPLLDLRDQIRAQMGEDS